MLKPSAIKRFFKKFYLSLFYPTRLVVLDHPLKPFPFYTKEKPHRKLYGQLADRHADYVILLTASKKYFSVLQALNKYDASADAIEPGWNNHYFPGLDVLTLYTIISERRPKKYIEIGSGTSTKIAAKVRRENKVDFTITCIDPSPRQEIEKLADKWYRKNLQDTPLTVFENLAPNDIIFFDGTHRLLPASDVQYFFLEVLPSLPPGVLVQIHDIYLPYDYPQFMCDRYYSENYLLGAVILSNPKKYTPVSPNFYISETPALANLLTDFWEHPNLQGVEKHGGSFWFQIAEG